MFASILLARLFLDSCLRMKRDRNGERTGSKEAGRADAIRGARNCGIGNCGTGISCIRKCVGRIY